MALNEKQVNWKFSTKVDSFIKVLSYEVTGSIKYLEDPIKPEEELISVFKNRLENPSILVLPPCSEQTIVFAKQNMSNLVEVIVVDNNLDRLKVWQELGLEEKYKYLSSKLIPVNIAGAEVELKEVLHNHYGYLALGKVAVYVPRRFKRFEKEFSNFLEENILKQQQQAASNIIHKTTRNWHKITNLILNLQLNKEFYQLKNTSSKKCGVVIVGAGPSLDKNIKKLVKFAKNVLIISVDAALVALLDNGIVPDLIVSLEDVLSWRFFSNNLDKLKDVPLLLPLDANSVIFRNYLGPIIVIQPTLNINIPGLDKLLDLDNGSCVGHQALSVAMLFKPTEVIMVGFDLAYDGEKGHFAKMAVKVDKSFEDKFTYYWVEGISGEKVKTNQSLFYYLKYFEEMIKDIPCPIIDATEGGALIKGTVLKTLEDSLRGYDQEVSLDIEKLETDLSYDNSFNIELHKIKKILDSEFAKIDNLTAEKPYNPFANFFLESTIFEIIKKGVNASLMIEFSLLLNNYEPTKFSAYKDTLIKLLSDFKATTELLNIILKFKEFETAKDNILLLKPDNLSAKVEAVIVEKYPSRLGEIVASSDLTTILRTIYQKRITTIVVVDGEVFPDSWIIPNISCVDIKSQFKPQLFEKFLWQPNYSILCLNETIKSEWEKFCPKDVKIGVLC